MILIYTNYYFMFNIGSMARICIILFETRLIYVKREWKFGTSNELICSRSGKHSSSSIGHNPIVFCYSRILLSLLRNDRAVSILFFSLFVIIQLQCFRNNSCRELWETTAAPLCNRHNIISECFDSPRQYYLCDRWFVFQNFRLLIFRFQVYWMATFAVS